MAGTDAATDTRDRAGIALGHRMRRMMTSNTLEWEGGGEGACGDMRFMAAVESLTPLRGLQFDPASGDSRRWSPPPNQRREIGRMIKALVFGDSAIPSFAPLTLDEGVR